MNTMLACTSMTKIRKPKVLKWAWFLNHHHKDPYQQTHQRGRYHLIGNVVAGVHRALCKRDAMIDINRIVDDINVVDVNLVCARCYLFSRARGIKFQEHDRFDEENYSTYGKGYPFTPAIRVPVIKVLRQRWIQRNRMYRVIGRCGHVAWSSSQHHFYCTQCAEEKSD